METPVALAQVATETVAVPVSNLTKRIAKWGLIVYLGQALLGAVIGLGVGIYWGLSSNAQPYKPYVVAYDLPSLVRIKPSADIKNLDPEFVKRLATALGHMPLEYRHQLTIGSGYRGNWEQFWGWARHKFGGPVAVFPGTSMHNKGLAVDFHPKQGHSDDPQNIMFRRALTWLYANGPQYGVCGLTVNGKHWEKDLVHFEMCDK